LESGVNGSYSVAEKETPIVDLEILNYSLVAGLTRRRGVCREEFHCYLFQLNVGMPTEVVKKEKNFYRF
jgi:hypothetical protein